MTKSHTDREYDAELHELRQRLLLMAGRVEGMIASAVKALDERDVALAENTIAADREVNRDEVEMDDKCLVLLAKRQPMASDLRFITQTLKMVTDLERIADLAVNICERVVKLSGLPNFKRYEEIPKMAVVVQSMIRDAIDAFVARDADRAQTVLMRDDEVDEYYHRVVRELLALMERDPGNIERGIHVQSIAKFLERIGDHATNLAEEVIYMLKGQDVRHHGLRTEKPLSPSGIETKKSTGEHSDRKN